MENKSNRLWHYLEAFGLEFILIVVGYFGNFIHFQ
jgi:hypothetical protein